MNGFAHGGLNEEDFGPKGGLDTLKTFDAFRELLSPSPSLYRGFFGAAPNWMVGEMF